MPGNGVGGSWLKTTVYGWTVYGLRNQETVSGFRVLVFVGVSLAREVLVGRDGSPAGQAPTGRWRVSVGGRSAGRFTVWAEHPYRSVSKDDYFLQDFGNCS